jgi:hypothetical protein
LFLFSSVFLLLWVRIFSLQTCHLINGMKLSLLLLKHKVTGLFMSNHRSFSIWSSQYMSLGFMLMLKSCLILCLPNGHVQFSTLKFCRYFSSPTSTYLVHCTFSVFSIIIINVVLNT